MRGSLAGFPYREYRGDCDDAREIEKTRLRGDQVIPDDFGRAPLPRALNEMIFQAREQDC